MTPRREQRTATCGRREAGIRLAQAQKFYEVAELVEAESAALESSSSVAAALAVLSGIAAADAACCAALGRRSRGKDHQAAVELLRQVEPHGSDPAKNLGRLLSLKDSAHYGVIYITAADLASALRNAKKLLDFARDVTRR